MADPLYQENAPSYAAGGRNACKKGRGERNV